VSASRPPADAPIPTTVRGTFRGTFRDDEEGVDSAGRPCPRDRAGGFLAARPKGAGPFFRAVNFFAMVRF
jgi:hypothetical protein